MKNILVAASIVGIIGILFLTANGQDQLTTQAWLPHTTVEEIVFEGSGNGNRVYAVFKDKPNLANCSGNSRYARVYGNNQKGKYMVSALLTAKAANLEIRPAIHNTTCDDWNRPVVNAIMLR